MLSSPVLLFWEVFAKKIKQDKKWSYFKEVLKFER